MLPPRLESLSAGLLDAVTWAGIVWTAGVLVGLTMCSGCVTGGQVCLETAHGYGPGPVQRDSVGASACLTLERRQ
jgi:hypothetical protein